MLQSGQKAPDFTAETTTGDEISLGELRGKHVVLFFYPKDDTPGCTIEACSFRDALDDFQAAETVVLGVSADDRESHVRFTDKYSLNFPLLVDTDGALARAYGVPQSDSGSPRRVTFLIGPDGSIMRTWEQVDVNTHAAELLEHINATTES